MKTVKRKTVRQGTRRMINAQAVTPYGLLTYRGGETAFFLLRPTCISVLPEDALAARVGALVTVFKSQPELEILCLNSRGKLCQQYTVSGGPHRRRGKPVHCGSVGKR